MGKAELDQILLEDPDRPKVVCLKDGRKVPVPRREAWATHPTHIAIVDANRDEHAIPYHAISSILTRRSGRPAAPAAR